MESRSSRHSESRPHSHSGERSTSPDSHRSHRHRSHRSHRRRDHDREGDRSEKYSRHRSHKSSRSHRSSRSERDRSRSRESRKRSDSWDSLRDDSREQEDKKDDINDRTVRERSPIAELKDSSFQNTSQGKWVIDGSDSENDQRTTLNQRVAEQLREKLKASKQTVEPEVSSDGEERTAKHIVLTAMDTQMMCSTSAPSNPKDMTIAEMLAEERRLNHMGNAASRAAETISRDKGFSTDNDYVDENSSKLASLVQKKQIDLKNMAISQVQKMTKILDSCELCSEDRAPNASVIATGTRVYLALAPTPELAPLSCVIVPIAHHRNTLECDPDEWEEIRNFQKCLAVMYMSMKKGVVFYENAARPHLFGHAHIVCIPIPLNLTSDVSPFFQEAFLTSDTEWSQHRKVINTGGKGKLGFQTSIAKEAPYVHVWLTIDGGVGHIVEDNANWPKEDRFAREVIAGLLQCPPEMAKRTTKWSKDEDRLKKFRDKWDNYDWTKQLT